MSSIDLIVPIGANQHEVLQIRPSKQILQQIKRCPIEPLEIVKKQHQRMLRPGEYADESPENELEAALCLLSWKLREGWLFADYERQFGNEVDHEPPVRA